jgi:hypothetical protein
VRREAADQAVCGSIAVGAVPSKVAGTTGALAQAGMNSGNSTTQTRIEQPSVRAQSSGDQPQANV